MLLSMWTQIFDGIEGEGSRLAETFSWVPVHNGQQYGNSIRIEVWEYPSGNFLAIPSHRIKTPGQATPYASMHIQVSVEAAVRDCIRGFQTFMTNPNQTEWIPLNL